ncbi:MAG TPA: glycosyltransferase family 39 protein, partial [Planctomycetaceae bacterium]|nr:glycosyltransferase family 39 protein [Planctomycetaceae bacterium]
MKSKKKRRIAPPPETETFLVSTAETMPLAVGALPQSLWLPRCLLAFALLSGVGLMVPTMFAGPLVLDEYGTYWLVDVESPGTLLQRSLDYENIPPLTPYLQRQLCRLFGTSEFSLRLLSMLSYWLAIGAVYLLARDLLGRVEGGLAANVLAWHPEALGEIRIARCYGLTMVLSTLAFWITVRWSRKPLSLWVIPWALVNVALIWTHYLNVSLIVAQGVWLLWSFRRGSLHVWTLCAIGFGAVVAATIPLLAPIFRIAVWGDSFNFQPEAPIWDVIVPMWWLGLPVAWLAGRWLMSRSHRPLLAIPNGSTMFLLFAWGLLPAILAAVVCQGDLSSLSNPRYRIGFVAPSACLLVACLVYRRTATVATASVLVALSLAWLMSPRWPWEMKRLGNPRAVEWQQMALDVEARGQAGEPLFVQGGLGEGFMVPSMFDDLLFQDYVACRMGRFYLKTDHPRYGLPFLWGKS